MFESFLPKEEDGLKAVSWGLTVIWALERHPQSVLDAVSLGHLHLPPELTPVSGASCLPGRTH